MTDIASANGHLPADSPPPATLTVKAPAPVARPPDEFDTATAFLRLLVGAALEGADELRVRLRQWDAAVHAAQTTSPPEAATASAPEVLSPDLLRAAAIGMLFDAQARVRRGFSALGRRWSDATRDALDAVAPIVRQTPLEPVMMWVDNALFEWQVTVDRWVALGSREEREARLLARQAVPGLFEEVVDLLTKNPELRALVLRESTSLTTSAVQEVRERVGTADALVERLVHGLMRRPAERGAPDSALPAPHPADGTSPQQGGPHDAG